MSIDFSALVLAPAMTVFGKPVLITPISSQPSAAPYVARGIWSVENTNILTEDGGTLSSVRLLFGIRMSEFSYPPAPGDWITSAASDLPLGFWQGVVNPDADIDFVIDDFTPDGQGKAQIIVKRVT